MRRDTIPYPTITWPEGKTFAFSAFDDTDLETMENAPPVYAFMRDLGFRTTKSVWPVRGSQTPKLGGTTCADPEYAEWALQLQDEGFEIGLHNVTYHTSSRSEILDGLEQFKELFGHYPRTHANHYGCEDAIYWGPDRTSGLQRAIYRTLTAVRRNGMPGGHVEGSPLFWGDHCRERIDYVRNFVYGDINTLKACPFMPYHDPLRPFVNEWFASSEGAHVDSFVKTISEARQDRLETEGGACIMYTHFGFSFFKDGRLDSRFKALMERLSNKNGWFVPVSTLLDYLKQQRGPHHITGRERRRLERKWILQKLRTRGTT